MTLQINSRDSRDLDYANPVPYFGCLGECCDAVMLSIPLSTHMYGGEKIMSEFLNCSLEWYFRLHDFHCTGAAYLYTPVCRIFFRRIQALMYLQVNSCECTSVISRLFFVCALRMFVVFVKLNKCQHCKSLSACVHHWSSLSAAARPYRANEILAARQIDAIP